jgi:hypothetical protein
MNKIAGRTNTSVLTWGVDRGIFMAYLRKAGPGGTCPCTECVPVRYFRITILLVLTVVPDWNW